MGRLISYCYKNKISTLSNIEIMDKKVFKEKNRRTCIGLIKRTNDVIKATRREQSKEPPETAKEPKQNINNTPKYIICTIWGIRAFIFFFFNRSERSAQASRRNLRLSEGSPLFAFTKSIDGRTCKKRMQANKMHQPVGKMIKDTLTACLWKSIRTCNNPKWSKINFPEEKKGMRARVC